MGPSDRDAAATGPTSQLGVTNTLRGGRRRRGGRCNRCSLVISSGPSARKYRQQRHTPRFSHAQSGGGSLSCSQSPEGWRLVLEINKNHHQDDPKTETQTVSLFRYFYFVLILFCKVLKKRCLITKSIIIFIIIIISANVANLQQFFFSENMIENVSFFLSRQKLINLNQPVTLFHFLSLFLLHFQLWISRFLSMSSFVFCFPSLLHPRVAATHSVWLQSGDNL